MEATVVDVAAAARVSPTTVSNVLRHPERVRASTRSAVLVEVERLGYRPNHAARILSGRSRDVVAVVGDLKDRHALPAFAIIDRTASEMNLLAQFVPRKYFADLNPIGLGMVIVLGSEPVVSAAAARRVIRGLMAAAGCPDHPHTSSIVRLEDPFAVQCGEPRCGTARATCDAI